MSPASAGARARATTGGTISDADVAWIAAWSNALDALELDVDSADELLRTAHLTSVQDVARASAWQPPQDLGPLPASLEVRARALLRRQLETSRRVGQAVVVSRRQLAATRALSFRDPEAAVYFDDEV
ncbi:hypothetical protein [Cellulomonas sp. URHD0024]|uniref:hypothetical protein n=1 Tax=Cellulomonas sp. URHD0024 TaxID=1302620 RepID=UPI0003FA3952|nr:hypothetical protein [Cellulomonas sp. URHD0024]